MDNERIRKYTVCPLCYGPKNVGLVVCWPCYGQQGLRYGNPEAERKIQAFEDHLAEVNRTPARS